MAECPWRANARISSRRAQGFFSRLKRSTRCALVSLISFSVSADALMAPLPDLRSFQFGPKKRKAHRLLWRWALPKNEYGLGSGFISQRDGCRLTATLTHFLAKNSHED